MITHALAEAVQRLQQFLTEHVGSAAIAEAGVLKRLQACRSALLSGLLADARAIMAETMQRLRDHTGASASTVEYAWMVEDLVARSAKIVVETRLIEGRLLAGTAGAR